MESKLLTPDSVYNDTIERAFEPASQELKSALISLDLVRITDRILTCGTPTSGPSNPRQNKNNVEQLANFLNQKYPRYMIWNLSGLLF